MRLWQFLLLLAGLCLLGAAAVLTFNFVVLPRVIHRNAVIQMPDLRGMDLEEAKDRVAGLRLQVEWEREKNHPTVALGRILEQIPVPASPIRRGRVVRVVTSAGPPAGELPDLAGLSLHQAEVTLQREAYRLGRVVQLRRSDVTVATVVFQSPAAGRHLPKGTVVDLVVGQPTPPVLLRMPDLRGEPLFRARQVVAAAGCMLAPVAHERTSDHPPNIILSQTPPPGQRIEKGERIELVASTR